MTRTRRCTAALATAALTVAVAASALVGCSSSSSDGGTSTTVAGTPTSTKGTQAARAEAFSGDIDAFYAKAQEPAPDVPPGTLLRYAPMANYGFDGATAYRIAYTSESLTGKAIVETGVGGVPDAAAPEGGRPMITVVHGTTGIGDDCAPSKHPKATELTLVGGKLASRFLIAATDYEGIGTPGRHPYLVGESEGRSGIDALLAAGQLPNAHPGTRFVIAGYSQGGHAALWTSQVAAEWAPDLEVVGTFAGAPASEVGILLKAAAKVKGFALMVVAGLAAAHPDADLSKVLTPKGQELLDVVDEPGCAPHVFTAAGDLDGKDIFVAGGADRPPWSDLAAAQDAGQEKANDAPTLLIHSTGDGTVPTFFVDAVQARMCGNGQVVERQEIDAGGHGEAAPKAYDIAVPWLEARFAKSQPDVQDSCGS
ncbi:MAG: lipase family protein [Acidimicrobiales bacterium]